MVQAGDRGKNASSPANRRSGNSVTTKALGGDARGREEGKERVTKSSRGRPTGNRAARGGSPASVTGSNGVDPVFSRHTPKHEFNSSVSQQQVPPPPPLSESPLPEIPSNAMSISAPSSIPFDSSSSSTPFATKPSGPLPRIPVFPLVDSYVPDPKSTDRRHPRQLVPEDLGFPTSQMTGKIRKEDLDDRLLMATCAVMHDHQNRALCPKEVAEVMLERGWLKNAGTSPFAHVSTCIRAHIARASSANPPYLPLLIPFELVGALTVEEIRAVGLHAEQRPAVKRGTLWYLNPRVFGPGIGADDPFVRCRKEVGMAGSDREGVYVRGLVPLHSGHSSVPSPGLRLSSTLYISNGAEDEGDEEGMGRGKRKRRASSAMMAAMSTSGESPSGIPHPPPTANAPAPSPAPISNPSIASASPVPIPSAKPLPSLLQQTPNNSTPTRRNAAFGASSAPVRSSLPKLKLRLTALEEVESDVVDSDGHTGEAAARRKKNKKKIRRAGSEGVSRSGSVEPTILEGGGRGEGIPRSRSSTFSATSSAALLAQSLLAASTSTPNPTSYAATAIPPPSNPVVSPDELSLSNAPVNLSFPRPTSLPATPALHVSMSAPNIFSHHFAAASSPVDLMDQDSSSDTAKNTPVSANPLESIASPPRSDSADEEDFHEAMLRGDDFDFEWGVDSYTTGSSSIISVANNNNNDKEGSIQPQNGDLTLPLQSSKQRNKVPPFGDESALLDDSTIDTPATTPRNPDEMDHEDTEEKETHVKKVEADEKDEGPLGKISRVGMQATLCGAMEHGKERVEDDEDEVVLIEKESSSKPDVSPPTTTLDSFTHETPARRRQPSALRTPSDALGVTAPLPSPLPLDLPSMLPLTFPANEFDFVGLEEDDFLRSSSVDHADSADDEGDEDDREEEEEDDMVTVKVEDDYSHFTNLSHPSSRASSIFPLDAFDRELLLRATSTGASSNSSEGSDSFDPHLVVSSSLLATGLPVPQQAPSPPEATEWSMNVDFEELDGELGTHVDLLGPESIGLEELDLAWAGEEDEEQELDNDRILLASPKNRENYLSPLPGSSTIASASNTFLTGSSTPRFTTALPSPLIRRPSLMGDLGKGKPTVATTDQDDGASVAETSPPRRTSGRKLSKTLKAQEEQEENAIEKVQSNEKEEEKMVEGDGEETEGVRRSARQSKSVLASPRKSTRRSTAAAAGSK
ncbi:uncharacterized protein JCM6883_004955 [Sporobolomyces salmoneus]|uniref:uncharacterized protein n=1 Tax=Sporobolomyces salmoneus TaxID=183962 RepID=UPI00317A2A68